MAAPSSGALSLLGFARERQYNNYSSGTISGQISAADLWSGVNGCGSSGTNFKDGNSGQTYTTYPKPAYVEAFSPAPTNENRTAPQTPKNLSWNQWYNYDQDRKGSWFVESNFPICRALGVSMGSTNAGVFTLGVVQGCTPGSTNIGMTPERIAGSGKYNTTIEWNGASFSTGGSSPVSANMGTSGGSSTSGVFIRPNIVTTGNANPVTCQGKGFTYNGTSFTTRNLCCNVGNSNYMNTAANPSSGMINAGMSSSTLVQTGGYASGCRAFIVCLQGTNLCHASMANMSAGCRIMGGVIGAYPCGDTLAVGGYGLASTPRCDVELFNGSSWSSKANLSSGRFGFMTGAHGAASGRRCVWGGMGTICYNGMLSSTEDFNGTSWSTRTSYPQGATMGAFHTGDGEYNGYQFFSDCAFSVGGIDQAGVCSPSGAQPGYAINKAYSFCENSRRYSNV